MDFKGILRTILKICVPLFFGCMLLWLLYRKMDFKEIQEVIRYGVRYDILLLSLLFGTFANTMRAIRWKLLITSMGNHPKTMNVVWAVYGNYALNLVLPRIGEIWRCGVIKKYDNIPFSKLLGTLLVDRVSDSVVVGFMTLLIFAFNIEFFVDFFNMNPELLQGFRAMFNSIWIYAVAVILMIGIWIVFRYMKHFSFVIKAKQMLLNVWEGIKTIWYLKQKGLFLLQTLLIWVGYFVFFYITFYAFAFTKDLGIGVGLITFTMCSIGVGVPVQGGIGPWHFMVIATLICFGVNKNDAAAFALIVHTTQTVWTGLVGLVGIAALPISNRETHPATK